MFSFGNLLDCRTDGIEKHFGYYGIDFNTGLKRYTYRKNRINMVYQKPKLNGILKPK